MHRLICSLINRKEEHRLCCYQQDVVQAAESAGAGGGVNRRKDCEIGAVGHSAVAGAGRCGAPDHQAEHPRSAARPGSAATPSPGKRSAHASCFYFRLVPLLLCVSQALHQQPSCGMALGMVTGRSHESVGLAGASREHATSRSSG